MQPAPRTARGGGAPAILNPLLALIEAIEAGSAWHRAQNHRAQTTAAALTTTGARTTKPRTSPRAPYG
ncbi:MULTISPECIES: hypothetical protein [Streptomyces]|uniref:hypothetical protein n=1 Tax=Streptomyces TaxID=1883 RepID=UPI0002F3D518|nr:hypothetical protein [Streptomyces griseus]